jgi:hypothetical protein
MKVRRVAPFLLVTFVSCVLAELEPSLAVWSGALIWPLLVGASLLVAPWWSASPPQVAVGAAVVSVLPALHHAWVFNLEGNGILGWAALFSVVPLLLWFLVARRMFLVNQLGSRRPVFGVIAVVMALGYGMGAAYFANTYFDRGPVQHFAATVKNRFVSSYFVVLFRQYEVNVNPWGNHRRGDSICVERDVLEAMRDGEVVHIEQFPGLLGIPWVRVRPYNHRTRNPKNTASGPR